MARLPRQGRNGLNKLLKVTDRLGLGLVGAAVVLYVAFEPAKGKNGLKKEKEKYLRSKKNLRPSSQEGGEVESQKPKE